jgi:hypothetical protein
MQSTGYLVVVDAGTFGHVAYVVAVGGGSVTIEEEYNHYLTGTYDKRTVPASAFTDYIHFKEGATGTDSSAASSHTDADHPDDADHVDGTHAPTTSADPRGDYGWRHAHLDELHERGRHPGGRRSRRTQRCRSSARSPASALRTGTRGGTASRQARGAAIWLLPNCCHALGNAQPRSLGVAPQAERH